MSAGAHRDQQRVLAHLEPVLPMMVSCPTWVVGPKLQSSIGVASVPNLRATSAAPAINPSI